MTFDLETKIRHLEQTNQDLRDKYVKASLDREFWRARCRLLEETTQLVFRNAMTEDTATKSSPRTMTEDEIWSLLQAREEQLERVAAQLDVTNGLLQKQGQLVEQLQMRLHAAEAKAAGVELTSSDVSSSRRPVLPGMPLLPFVAGKTTRFL